MRMSRARFNLWLVFLCSMPLCCAAGFMFLVDGDPMAGTLCKAFAVTICVSGLALAWGWASDKMRDEDDWELLDRDARVTARLRSIPR